MLVDLSTLASQCGIIAEDIALTSGPEMYNINIGSNKEW